MRRLHSFVLFTLLSVFLTAAAFTEDAEVIYLQGESHLVTRSGARVVPDFGSVITTGDTVITGADGIVELEPEVRSSITVQPDTVFLFQEMESGGRSESVLSCALGSVKFSFDRLSGREPKIRAGNAIAGIRGTTFTVFAGVDGSSLYVVEEGLVAVEAENEVILLEAEEGVEVAADGTAGEKFTVLRGQMDFSSWNTQKYQAVLADPAAAARNIETQLEDFAGNIQKILSEYESNRSFLTEERRKLEEIEENEGKAARKSYYEDKVFPLEVETSYMRMNIRYHALSALSLRRYVLGRMYLRLKTAYIHTPEDPIYREFLAIHQRILDSFEQNIVPYLVEADI